MISTANITMQFAAKPLFENVSVKFTEGGHYGLIGANGAGKSTFMKILAGTLQPTNGSVMIPPNARMASLSQDQFAYEEVTVLDAVLMGHEELWAIKEKKDALYALPEMTEEQGMEVADLEMRYAELDGYSAESRAAELLLGVEIPESCHYEKMSTIAPGLKLRVLLTQVLFSDPDIMLLDEPTNNLDINTIRWLEQTLKERKCTLIIISHDRHFLNTVCTHTADLDYGSITLFPGGYDEYMSAALQAREQKQADVARKQAKVSELQDFVRRFSANASKSKQATSRQKQIDKIVIEKVKPSSRKFPYIRIEQDKPLHRYVCEVKDLSNGYDDCPDLFKDLNLHIEAGQKVAIIGPSGIGKTTLLKTLAGVMSPRTGFVKWSENANISYFAQDHADEFDDDRNLFDWMSQHGQPGDDEQVIRGALGRMLFTGDDYKKCVRVTSGGEKVRLLLAKLILQRPNILLLDEPTNHLDMESIEALNMGLEMFPGTLFFVSHDRAFVSSLATQIIEMKPGGQIEHYLGNYEDYLEAQAK